MHKSCLKILDEIDPCCYSLSGAIQMILTLKEGGGATICVTYFFHFLKQCEVLFDIKIKLKLLSHSFCTLKQMRLKVGDQQRVQYHTGRGVCVTE